MTAKNRDRDRDHEPTAPPRLDATGAVLCGGRSTRMGRPKALLPWRGTTLIEHTVSVLSRVVREVIVVSSDELELPALPCRVVRDREPALGPLGGIRESLEAATTDIVFVSGTDAPFLSEEFVRTVLSFGRAAAPVIDGFVQPLATAYPRALLPNAIRLIEEGRMRPLFLLEEAGYHAITSPELPELESLRNCNTAEAYLEAVRRDAPDAQVHVEWLGLARHRAGVTHSKAVPGCLGDILESIDAEFPDLNLLVDGQLSRSYLVALDGRRFLRDPGIPIGPGDRLVVLDTAIGG